MPQPHEQDPTRNIHGEFDEAVFVDRYEDIADTFIDTFGAAKSLASQLPPGSSVFELGLGTGYFAQFLMKDGFQVSGIQPADGMLRRLKAEHPQLLVKGEQYIQDYEFDDTYNAIVSHSSVFLFTKPNPQLAEALGTNLIFQSFIEDDEETLKTLDKVMESLTPNGKFFINIQPNAQPHAQIDENLAFDMSSCDYDFDRHLVEKVFAITSNGVRKVLPPDVSRVLKWEEFERLLEGKGYNAKQSEDGYWVALSNNPAGGPTS